MAPLYYDNGDVDVDVDDSNIAARNNAAKKCCIVPPQQLTMRVGMQNNEVIVVFF